MDRIRTANIKKSIRWDYHDKNYCVSDIPKRHRKVQAISFFSGCGGLDIGASLARVKVISSLDFDPDCVRTISENSLFKGSDIRHANIVDVKAREYREVIKKSNPEKLIIIGGPPCQPFSKAGYWIGNESRQGMYDPRNMIGEYLRIINELRPNGFLLENVESLLHPTNQIAVAYIADRIEKMGYQYEIVRANAVDYGVPQRRKRVFFIASQRPIEGTPKRTHGSPQEIAQEPSLLPYERVVDWIGKFDTPEFFEKEEVTSSGTYAKELQEVPLGKNYIALTSAAGHKKPRFVAGKRFWNFLLKLHPEETSWTIAAQPGPWVGPFHWTSRRLRVPEIASIQTFPQDYRFFGTRRSIQKQIGNAVPPLLGKAMVEFLVKNLK